MNIIIHEVNGLRIGQRCEDGYVNLTKMAQANGKKLNDYLRLTTTKSFLTELSRSTGISVDQLIIKIVKGENKVRGTWGHPQVAIHCGQWCSAKFAVLVSQWVVDWMSAARNPVQSQISPELLIAVKSYIECSQSLNRVIHTAIHQQSDIIRSAEIALFSKSQSEPQTVKIQAASNSLNFQKHQSHSHSLKRIKATGSLCRYLKNKQIKSGAIATYPRVEGIRDPNNLDHWYWNYCYEVLVNGKWTGRSLSVPKHKVAEVQKMISDRLPVSAIKAFLSQEKSTH